MKKIFKVVMVVICMNISVSYSQQISIIPKPTSITEGIGSFTFNSKTSVSLPEAQQQKAVNYLLALFNKSSGYKLPFAKKSSAQIVLETQVDLPVDAYQLVVTPKKISIKSSSETGFFYAVQSIRQLLPVQIESQKQVKAVWTIPSITINDEPRFGWRGMHMDFSRHFFRIEEVKQFLDYMALYKLNTYHMHLTDDQGWRIEIKKYPLLTQKGAWREDGVQDSICNERAKENPMFVTDKKNFKVIDGKKKYGGFFTQAQIKEIVAYANERCITVVPEIDMPGHLKSAIDNYPFLSCTGKSGWETVFTYPACLGKPTTAEFLKNILVEIIPLFPSKYIHIGGDEVNIKSWQECTLCQSEIKKLGLKDEHELQSHFNRDLETFLTSKGKKLLGWDEIVTGGLTKDATVMWWRGWRPEAPKKAADNGNFLINTSTAAYYFDFLNEGNTMQKVYELDALPKYISSSQAKYVLGVQANLWAEWIPNFSRLQYQAFPRMMALAETAWCQDTTKAFKKFNKRVENQYSRLDELGIHYYIPYVEGLDKNIVFIDSTKVTLNLAYPLSGTEIYYTLDGSFPTKSSYKYLSPISLNKSATIKAVAYRNNVFNDFKTAEIQQQSYRQASNLVPEKKGIKKFVIDKKIKNVEDISLSENTQFQQLDSINIAEVKTDAAIVVAFSGYFKAATDGIYEFEIRSDGGSLLYLNGELLVDNGGFHGNRKRYGKIALKKGWHPLQVKYLSSTKPVLEITYNLQGDKPISLNNLVLGF